MLFEIHDIILHRLWKRAKRKLFAFVSANVGGPPLTPRQMDEYARLSIWERRTRRWYLNHQYKTEFV